MMFHMRLLARMRCPFRSWRNLVAMVFLFLRNLLVMGNIAWVCHEAFSLNMYIYGKIANCIISRANGTDSAISCLWVVLHTRKEVVLKKYNLY